VTPKPVFRDIETARGEPTPVAMRSIVFVDGARQAPVFRRDALGAGHAIAGPAIVEEPASVTVLNPGHRMTVDRFGNLVIDRV
jgi:N-methylhydantoinase A